MKYRAGQTTSRERFVGRKTESCNFVHNCPSVRRWVIFDGHWLGTCYVHMIEYKITLDPRLQTANVLIGYRWDVSSRLEARLITTCLDPASRCRTRTRRYCPSRRRRRRHQTRFPTNRSLIPSPRTPLPRVSHAARSFSPVCTTVAFSLANWTFWVLVPSESRLLLARTAYVQRSDNS